MTSLIVEKQPKSSTSEAYRTLRTNLQFSVMQMPHKKIIITSSEPGEGKTQTTANLALSIAQSGKKVLIIDCDMRKPTIYKVFGISNMVGFANKIIEDLPFEDVIYKYSDNLHIIPSGKASMNPAELLDPEYIVPIFNKLEEKYDYILIDTPPVVTVTDAQLLASIADGVIMVIGAGESHKKVCKKAFQLLQNVNAKVLGVVLNKLEEKQGYSYNYKYYYGTKKKEKKVNRKRSREVAISE